MAFELPINAKVVTSSSYISEGISLRKNTSSFSLYYSIAGSGSVDFFVHTSPDGINFVKQSRALKRGVTAGASMVHLPIMPCDAFKIEVEETAGSAMTVTAKINLLPGQFGDIPGYDGSSDAIKTIDYPHHEIHDGRAFIINEAFDLAISYVIDVRITTPNTVRLSHFLLGFDTESQYEWWFTERATITVAGTAYTPINLNRNSDNTSGMVVDIITNATAALANDDTTEGAVIIMHGFSGSGKQEGGKSAMREELILKKKTIYNFKGVAVAAGYIHGNMSWYEHINR